MKKTAKQLDREIADAVRASEFDAWLAKHRGLSEGELRSSLERLDVDTLDRWAFGVVGDQVITIEPAKLTVIYQDDLENAKHQAKLHRGGRLAWAKSVSLATPIDVVVKRPEEFIIGDGHHRYLAATLTNRPLRAKVKIDGNPINVLLERARR